MMSSPKGKRNFISYLKKKVQTSDKVQGAKKCEDVIYVLPLYYTANVEFSV